MSSSQRRVLLAKPRGYCAGVDRAVQAVEMALTSSAPPVYVRRQIVHNTHVVSTLEKRGAIFVAEVDEVPSGAVVVFSAHGIAPEVRRDAESRGLHAIDATCPLVTKVHNEARRFAARDYDILLVGHEGHEEVVGRPVEAPSRVRLVDGAGGPAQVEVRDPSKVVWLSGTTLSVDETWRPSTPCASASRPCSTRRATTSATPRRTGRPRSGHRRPVRPGDRAGSPTPNSVRLVEVAGTTAPRPPTWSMTPGRSTSAGWTA